MLKKLRIFDFDDTLVKSKSKVKVTKDSGQVLWLNSHEYAIYKAEPGDQFDYSQFTNSVVDPQQIKWTMDIFKKVIAKNGTNGVFILTARASKTPVQQYLIELGLPKVEVIALGDSDPEAKSETILYMIKMFKPSLVEFFDDSVRNITAVDSLKPIAARYNTNLVTRLIKARSNDNDGSLHEEKSSSLLSTKSIGFIAGGFKPFTKGHYFIINNASKENDLVYLFIGKGDRIRPGEVSVKWTDMEKIWNKYLLPIMPNNVIVEFSRNPVGDVYKKLEDYNNKPNDKNVYKIYGDEKDLKAYYTSQKLTKYIPNLLANDQVKFIGYNRNQGVNISGTMMRNFIAKNDVESFKSGLPEPLQNDKVAKDIMRMLNSNTSDEFLVKEGGLAGHMMHIHENLDLTFGEIKNIVSDASEGKLQKITEKVDGQNIFFTYNLTQGELRFARNKGDIVSGGMNLDAINAKWASKPNIAKTFANAYNALNYGLGSLPNQVKSRIFGMNGNIWYNAEVVYSNNVNVINYGQNAIIIHRSGISYDQNGKPLNIDTSVNYDRLINVVDRVNKVTTKTDQQWQVKKPIVIPLARLIDNKPQQEALSKINNIQKNFNLTDENTIGDMVANIYATNILQPLFENRFSLDQLIEMAKIIIDQNKNVLSKKSELIQKFELSPEDIKLIGKNMSELLWKNIKMAVSSIELIIHDFATGVLNGINSALILDPNKENERLKKETQLAIDSLKNLDDPKVKQLLAVQLEKLKNINTITAIEGITFDYNGNTYKLTGAFAPVNKLLGYFKYGY